MWLTVGKPAVVRALRLAGLLFAGALGGYLGQDVQACARVVRILFVL